MCSQVRLDCASKALDGFLRSEDVTGCLTLLLVPVVPAVFDGRGGSALTAESTQGPAVYVASVPLCAHEARRRIAPQIAKGLAPDLLSEVFSRTDNTSTRLRRKERCLLVNVIRVRAWCDCWFSLSSSPWT